MKHNFVYAAVVMSAVGFIAPFAMADEAAKPADKPTECQAAKAQTMTGAVSVAKDFEGAIEKVTLTVSVKNSEGEESEVAYSVTLDENGKKLAALDGKKVEVSAVLTKKEIKTQNDEGETETSTQLWLTVKSFKAVEVKAPVAAETEE